MRLLPALALLALACRAKDDTLPESSVPADPLDIDGDGFDATEDCDDEDPAVSPAAAELCDGVDNDCDGQADEDAADALAWYADVDGDGYGDAAAPSASCTQPAGTSATADDCDDRDPAIHPGAEEPDCADPTDYNCDGSVGYADADGDGYAACEECDDSAAGVRPGAVELCDGVDNDCSGEVDDGAADAPTWYQDSDGDGYGDPDYTTESCEEPVGYTANDEDCDPADAAVNPGAAEVCDGVDNDCDGAIDPDSATDAPTWYTDADADGYGDPDASQRSCTQPAKTASNAGDCDDTEPAAWTGASEVCDEVDNDCDGSVDEDVESSWYLDADGDGYGDPDEEELACAAPTARYTADSSDCDDGDADISPLGTEACDGVDNDCDGTADNGSEVVGESGCAALSCADVLANRSGAADGLYFVDPDGAGEEEVWCDMSTDSGGWTLVAVSSDDGQTTWTWANRTYWETSTTTFGSVSALHKDYRAGVYTRLDFTDLLFVHSTPSSPSSPHWAAYHNVGTGSYDLGTAIDAVAERTLYSSSGGWTMSAGTLTTSSTLCSTNLAFNACGRDGTSGCADSDDTHGPTWNINNNNGCPWDDTSPYGGLGPHRGNTTTEYTTLGFGWALGINTGSAGTGANNMRVYVR